MIRNQQKAREEIAASRENEDFSEENEKKDK